MPLKYDRFQFVVKVEDKDKIGLAHNDLVGLLAASAIDSWLGASKKKEQLSQKKTIKGLKIGIEKEGDKSKILDLIKRSRLVEEATLNQELEIGLEKSTRRLPKGRDQKSLEKYLRETKNYLNNWYLFSSTLSRNQEILRVIINNEYDNLCYEQQKASFQGNLNLFQKLAQGLTQQKQKYEEESQRCREQEGGFERTYLRHLKLIQQEDENDLYKLLESFDIAKKAIMRSYQFKIDGAAYKLAVQSVEEIETRVQLHLESLFKSEQLLKKIKESIGLQSQSSRLHLEELSAHINLTELREKIEAKLGHNLAFMGEHEENTGESFKLFLFEELEPIARKISWSGQSELN